MCYHLHDVENKHISLTEENDKGCTSHVQIKQATRGSNYAEIFNCIFPIERKLSTPRISHDSSSLFVVIMDILIENTGSDRNTGTEPTRAMMFADDILIIAE